MAKTDNLTDFLTDLADGIRAKTGETGKINPQDFRAKIEGIQSEGIILADNERIYQVGSAASTLTMSGLLTSSAS